MKYLIAGNWKMNPVSQIESKEIFDNIREGVKDLNSEVVICPPYTCLYASAFGEGIISMGAQNIFYEDKGAYTGEISAEMIKDLGVKYVIIGHSERRKYFAETNEDINKKIKKALEVGLKVIFCIGETAEEREAGKKEEVLGKQIKQGLEGVENYENINVAYEPVWAIGTGNNCSVEETKESIGFIKGLLPENTRVIYGGSVKSDNSGDYLKQAGVGGLLVGGASLKPEEFIKIIRSAE